ncbi:MAG TPA: HEPN domain-containing protein [Longimicrobium sp.]|nr:HEPN domain-containing protein [Longimicrobium sp.]
MSAREGGGDTPPLLPANDAEFNALMERVDAELRADEVPFAARSMAALSSIARRFQIELPGWTVDRDPHPGQYTGMDLTIRVVRWIDERYGNRQQIDLRPGRTVVFIRGDLWEAWLPRLIGSHVLFASATEPSDCIRGVLMEQGPPSRYNVLDSITDLAPGLRRSLTASETQEILSNFTAALDDYMLIEQARHLPLVHQARHDYDATVHHLLNGASGQARWSALQAAEKMLKAYLTHSGVKPPFTHDLERVARKAVELGLGDVPEAWLSVAQCDAAVRYGDIRVPMEEAVAAHYASLDIGAHAASFIA